MTGMPFNPVSPLSEPARRCRPAKNRTFADTNLCPNYSNRMIPFTKRFSDEDLESVKQWIRDNLDTMPKSLQLSPSTFIADLPTTASYYIDIIDLHKDNPTYAGQIYHAFQIRERVEQLRAEGKAEGE